MIDYHTHTLLCNHAIGSMPAYIQNAVDKGLKEICFLDHLTIRSKDQNSMSLDEVPIYFQAVQRLKQRYKKIIKIKIGLEIDFNPKYADVFQDVVGKYAFDVIGSSLHFLNDFDVVSSNSAWKDETANIDAIFCLYFEQLSNMLDHDYFDVVCHFDLIKKFAHNCQISFDEKINEILLKMKNKNIVMELNTSGYDHLVKEPYPCFDIIKKCFKFGIGVVLGSDAHKPDDIGRHYDKALSFLRLAGYTHLTTFEKRRCYLEPI